MMDFGVKHGHNDNNILNCQRAVVAREERNTESIIKGAVF
jgi:hypothetical protein